MIGGVAACGPPTTDDTRDSGKLSVVASTYPMQFLVEQVGGDHVSVRSLTKPGVEPHDLELTTREIAALGDADLAVYASGFQPAVDEAMQTNPPPHVLDVAPAADLLPISRSTQGLGIDPDELDPHFWLDPDRYGKVGATVADQLARLDPTHQRDYAAAAARFTQRTAALSGQLGSGLRSCRITSLVTTHAAFGYLALRNGFTQIPLALDPEAEPSTAQLAEVAEVVRARHVTTIYAEVRVDPGFAQTVAQASGATTSTLDPIEGITEESAASDYFGLMAANLATLRQGQECP